MRHEGPRPQPFLEGACHPPSPGFTCAEVWPCNHGQAEPSLGACEWGAGDALCTQDLSAAPSPGRSGSRGGVCSLPAEVLRPPWAPQEASLPSRVQHVSPNQATPGSQRLMSCSGRKPSLAWKLKEASLQRPTRWQGPSKPHPPSAVLQAWPGNWGTRHKSLGFKLSSLDSDSVGEWLCHPHPVPGLGGWASGILPQGPPAFLGRGHKASAPPR